MLAQKTSKQKRVDLIHPSLFSDMDLGAAYGLGFTTITLSPFCGRRVAANRNVVLMVVPSLTICILLHGRTKVIYIRKIPDGDLDVDPILEANP